MTLTSLASLKRVIKPGIRLLCIENTLRPELNGRIRRVDKAQGESFAWVHDPLPIHEQTETGCSCGLWNHVQSHWRTIDEQFAEHVKGADRRSWTTYQKASEFVFDGSDTFLMQLKPGTHVKLQVLA